MKKLIFSLLLVSQVVVSNGQENYVAGTVTLVNGETISGLINDLFWRETPSSIKFKRNAGGIEEFAPSKLLGFSIGDKALYRSRLVNFDSTKNGKSDLTQDRAPAYKRAHVFLKVIVDAKKSLLVYDVYEQSHFFIQDDNGIEELVNHHYLANLGSGKLEMENKLYIPKLKEAFADCNKILISDKLVYAEKSLSQLFLEYSSCKGSTGNLYDKKEKIIVKKGIVGTIGYDNFKGFDGGVGYGFGGFLSLHYPNKVYKSSFSTELVYRKLGEQTKTVLGVKEIHQVSSMKLSLIGRTRLYKLPINSYIGIGSSFSVGLTDTLEKNNTKSNKKANTLWAGILNLGCYLTRNIAIDLRYEIGNGVNYDKQALAVTSGHSSLQASLLFGF